MRRGFRSRELAADRRPRLADYQFMQPYLAVNRHNPQEVNRPGVSGQTGTMPGYIDHRR